MLDILSIGNATVDVILQSKAFKVHRDEHSKSGYAQTLTFGTKVDVDEMYTSVGGGALNSATTFARQELKTGIVTQFGMDFGGKKILEHLKEEKINFQQSLIDHTVETPLSTVLLTYTGERTALAYRGKHKTLAMKRLPLRELSVAWLYITSFGGDMETLTSLVKHANKHNVKIAANPGRGELENAELKKILPMIDVLILNKQEAEMLVPRDSKEGKQLLQAFTNLHSGITIITNGARGAVASDGFHSYYVEPPQADVVDRLGAGDAFGSGFVAGFIQYGDMEKALKLAASNAGSVCEHYGSTDGILRASQRLRQVEVTKHTL